MKSNKGVRCGEQRTSFCMRKTTEHNLMVCMCHFRQLTTSFFKNYYALKNYSVKNNFEPDLGRQLLPVTYDFFTSCHKALFLTWKTYIMTDEGQNLVLYL